MGFLCEGKIRKGGDSLDYVKSELVVVTYGSLSLRVIGSFSESTQETGRAPGIFNILPK